MKRGFLLFLMISIQITILMGQTYQLPNGGFELWDGNGTGDNEPTNWNSFPSSNCTVASFACSTAQETRHSRSTDVRPGTTGTYSCKIFATEINFLTIHVIANGNMTTGRINIGSTTAASTSNNNQTIVGNSNHSQPLNGKPDSIRFWAKFVCPSTTQSAKISAIIHDNHSYHDPETGSENTYVVAKAISYFQRGNQDWNCYTIPFDYNYPASIPSYILISFTTNQVAGAGSANDNLYIDDVELVYNPRLANITLDGISISDFNPNQTDYYVSTCVNRFPVIGYTTASSQATVSVQEATLNNPQSIITVTQGNTTKSYTIHYSFLPEIEAPSVTHDYICGSRNAVLVATPSNNNTCRWYSSATGGNFISTNNTFTTPSVVSTTTTYYVSSYNSETGCESERVPVTAFVNPIPGIASTEPFSQCGGGEISLTATPGSNADMLRWYATASGGAILYTGLNFSTIANTSTTYYVTSYNSTSNCFNSTRVPITVTINPIPTQPSIENQEFCGEAQYTLSASPSTNGTICKWYSLNEDNSPIYTGNSLSIYLNQDTTLYITSYNETTHCESSKKSCSITIHPTYSQSLEITQCGSYTYNNVTYNQSGNYTIHLQTTEGCDSIINLQLTLHALPESPVVTPSERCGAGEITLTAQAGSNGNTCRWYNSNEATAQPIATSTTYSASLSESNTYFVSSYNATTQCESGRSPITATIHPIPNVPIVTNASHCGAGEVSLQATVTENGTQNLWYETENSTTILAQQSSYTFMANTSTSYWVSNYNATTGCESNRVPALVTLNPTYTIPQYHTACNNYIWYGQNYTSTGIYDTTFTTSSNCDSTIILHLTIYNSDTTDFSASICSGEDYTINGFNISASQNQVPGVYVHQRTLETVHQCDSIIRLTLTVNATPDIPTITDNSICGIGSMTLTSVLGNNATTCRWYNSAEESSYLYEGNNYNTPILNQSTNYYVSSYNNETQCESERVEVEAVVYPIYSDTITHIACDSYSWNGQEYTTSGIYPHNYYSINHCDSIEYLHLTIHSSIQTQKDTTVCDVFTWNETSYNESGNYSQTFEMENSCDSIVNYQVTIHHSDTTYLDESICQGEGYANNGFNISENETQNAGILERELHLFTQNNCDSLVVLTLTIHSIPIVPTVTSESRCGSGSLDLQAQVGNNGNTCRWYNSDEESSFLFEGNNFATSTLNQSTNYYVSSYNSETQCESEKIEVSAVVYPIYNDTITHIACDSYSWNGQEYTVSGIYPHNYYSINHCDSIKYLQLTIHSATYSQLDTTVCDEFVWNGIHYTESGLYEQSFNTIFGCDSIVTYNISVNYSDTTYLFDIICQGEGYANNGFNISENETQNAGTLERELHLFTQDNCDSLVVLTLTIHSMPIVPIASSESRCGSGTFDLHAQVGENGNICRWYNFAEESTFLYEGNNFTTSTLSQSTNYYVSSYNSETQCESEKIEVSAVVYPVYSDTITHIDCDSYSWNGQEYTVSGIYPYNYYSIHQCDSIEYLQLFIHSSIRIALDTTVCDQFIWNDISYTESGNYEQSFETVFGCDSIVTYHVTVNYKDTTYLSASICQGEGYYANGFSIPESETQTIGNKTYSILLSNQSNCDSLVTLTLTIHAIPSVPTTIGNNRCGSGTLSLSAQVGNNGTTCRWYIEATDIDYIAQGNHFTTSVLDASTTYWVSSYNSNTHCESERIAVTATINPLPAMPTVNNEARCGSGIILFSAEIDTNATTCRWYNSGLSTAPVQATALNYQITNVPATTSYFVAAYNENTNCYSQRKEVIATIHSIPTTPIITSETLCGEGEILLSAIAGTNATTCHWYHSANDEQWFLESNNYSQYFSQTTTLFLSSFNENTLCESSRISTTITVYPTYNHSFNETSCDSYTWNNQIYTQSGDYQQQFFTIHNCDSIVTLHLTIHNSKNQQFDTTVCDIFVWNNQSYTQSGTYEQVFETINGCDSIVTYHVIVNQTKTNTITANSCDFYQWNDEVYEESGSYNQYFKTSQQCDSIVTLHLTIYNSIETEFDASDCNQYSWNDELFYESGNYVRHFETIHHCDSSVTLHLSINQSVITSLFDTICLGETYYNHGFYLQPTKSGSIVSQKTLETIYQCDSIVILNLMVNPIYTQTINKMICENATYNFYGRILTEAGQYQEVLQSSRGCDSTINLNLTVGSEYRTILNEAICEGEVYQENGFNESTNGQYSLQYIASNGCDSIIELHLTVNANNTTNFMDTICMGERYQSHGFDIMPTEVGTITEYQYLENQFGCDSTIILTLTTYPQYHYNFNDTICINELYNQHGFDTVPTTEGTLHLTFTTTNIFGCDSTHSLSLTVLPKYYHIEKDTICSHLLPYSYNGNNLYNSDTYFFNYETQNGCDSIIEFILTVNDTNITIIEDTICSGFTYNQNGFNIESTKSEVIQVIDTLLLLTNSLNCDSTVQLHLTILPSHTNNYNDQICLGEHYRAYGFDTLPNHIGEYTLTSHYTNSWGCDSLVTVQLTVHPTQQTHLSASICLGEHYQQYGFDTIPTETGIYTLQQSLLNRYQCDSIITLTLTVNETYSQDTTVILCDTELPYWYNNERFDESGNYIISYNTINGCDSIINLHLLVNSSYHHTDELTICDSELPYIYGNETLTAPGNYTIYFSTINHCDSIVDLSLIVNSTITHTVSETICQNELPFTYEDSTFYETGNYTIYSTNENLCLTITYLTLTVNPIYHHYDTIIICNNELPFHYDNRTIHAAGNETFHYYSSNGCDSILSLTLIVNPTYFIEESTSICDNETYAWHGNNYNTTGIYWDSLQTINSCDSVYKLTLTVNPTYFFEESAVICDNETYSWHGNSYNTTGIYWDSLQTINSCDSVYKLTLTVNPTYFYEESTQICDNETYTWHGNSYNVTGIYWDSLQTVNSCDSVYKLTLTVNPTYYFEESATICDNETYSWHGNSYNTTGIYWDSWQTINSCDSVYKLTLTVNPTYLFEESATICDNETYAWHGNSYNTAGIYWDSLQTINSCDSVYRLILTVNPTYFIEESAIICDNETYSWHGNSYNTTGIYWDSLQTVNSCDSVYKLTLTVNPTYFIEESAVICDNGTYSWHGNNYNTIGIYWDSLQTVNSCDSVYMLTLTVNPTYFFEESATICDNETYAWHGNNYNTTGIYWDSLQTANSCDSVYKLTLTVNPTYFIEESAIICDNETYSWHGNSYNTTGIYWDSLQTINSCDSVYKLTLTVNPTYSFEESAVICDNETFSWHGNSYNSTGIYWDSLQTVNSCDSVYKLTLTVNPTYFFEESAVICDNETYSWHGNSYNTTGIYWDSLQTVNSCDSIYKLTLTVHPTYFIEESAVICDNETYSWHGNSYNTTGIYWDSLQTVNSCDSVYKLTLTVNPTYFFEESAVICDNETYNWHGNSYNTAGIYWDSLQTINSCDSVYKLTLSVNPTYFFEESAVICDNETFSWHGNSYNTAGIYWDSLQTVNSCDSVYKLTLTINPTYFIEESAVICDNETYNWHGNSYNTAGIYWDSLQTINSCDSIYKLTLTVNPTAITYIMDTICQGNGYYEHGFNLSVDTLANIESYEFEQDLLTQSGCDSTVVLSLTVKETPTTHLEEWACVYYQWNGEYYFESGTYWQSFTAANGCDSNVTLNLTIYLPTSDTITISNCNSYTINGETYTMSGIYYQVFTPDEGCDSTLTLIINIHESTNTFEEVSICENEIYEWHNQNLSVSGVYIDTLETIYGCDSICQITLTINPTNETFIEDSIYIGDSYEENGFTIPEEETLEEGIFSYEISLFNEWGCDSIVHLSLSIIDSSHNGINNLEAGHNLSVYPNPTQNRCTISSDKFSIYQIDLYDIAGKLIQRIDNISTKRYDIEVSDYVSGIYFIRITTERGIITKKLIKQ